MILVTDEQQVRHSGHEPVALAIWREEGMDGVQQWQSGVLGRDG